jgi:hypothetical protein
MHNPPATAASNDFFEGGGPDQQSPFSQLVEVRTSDGKGKAVLLVLLLLLLAAGGYLAYQMVVNGKDPVEHVKELLRSVGLFEEEPPPIATNEPPPPMTDPAPAEPPPPPPAESKVVAGNPYWALPNKLLGAKTELGRNWTNEEEENWRAQLAHKYTYQRWQTVMDIRKAMLRGSDALLWDAMQDKKFWTRMYAAVGLAEFNVEVSLNSLEGALASARSELVADFFERFTRSPNHGQAYILRQVVRLLDERGRLVVLHGIDKADDELRNLYVVAATQDPGRRVQAWAQRALKRRPVPAERVADLLAVVDGKVDGDFLIGGGAKPGAKAGAGKAAGAAADDVDGAEATPNEDVQFYQDDADQPEPAPDTTADPDTFEYSDQ